MDWGSLGSAIIGGVISVFGSWIVIIVNGHQDRKVVADAQKIQNYCLLQSILAEVGGIKRILEQQFKPRLNDSQDKFNWVFPLDSDYLAIYRSNMARVGLIPDLNLVQKIISFYITVQLFIDCLKTNNKELECLSNAKISQCGIEACESNLRISFKDNILPVFEELDGKIPDLDKSINAYLLAQKNRPKHMK